MSDRAQDLSPTQGGEPETSANGDDFDRRIRSRRRCRLLVRVLCLTVALIVAAPLVTAARIWYTARQDDRRGSAAIVVLGAAQFNGRPSPVLEWRLAHALELYRQATALGDDGARQPDRRRDVADS